MPPISRHGAGWARSLPSPRKFAWKSINRSNIRHPSSDSICFRIRRGLGAATITARRGPTITPARITAGPTIRTAAACPMSAACTVIAFRWVMPSALSPHLLRKGIAQADGSVEHWTVLRGIGIAHEIALPLELHHVVRVGLRDRGLDPCVLENLKRLRIEIGGEVGGVRNGF